MTHTIKLTAFAIALFLVGLVSLPHISQAGAVDVLIGQGKRCPFLGKGENSGLYLPFADINKNFPYIGERLNKNGCVDVSVGVQDMFQAGFIVFLSLTSLMAVVQISVAGIQWMMASNNEGGKSKAKEKLTGAIKGLILAFSGWVILYTVNVQLVLGTFNINSSGLATLVQGTNNPYDNISAVGNCIAGVVCNDGTDGYNAGDGYTTDISGLPEYGGATTVKQLIDGGRNGGRNDVLNGGVAITLYSSAGDSTTDSNTAIGKGNVENLLVPGSVALSPDVISRLNPKHGQQILVNGVSVGYWDDTTASSYNGTLIRNTVDLYNPKGTYGPTNSTFKVLPTGEISLGPEVRTPIPFPTN